MNRKSMWTTLRNLIIVIVILVILIILIAQIQDKTLGGLDFISDLFKFG